MPARPRIIAGLTLIAMLLASIHCICMAGVATAATSTVGTPADGSCLMPCCAGHGGAAHGCMSQHRASKSIPQTPCAGGCGHCGQSVMNDTVVASPHTLALESTNPPALVAINLALLPLAISRQYSSELPPSVHSRTLLSLHCALVI